MERKYIQSMINNKNSNKIKIISLLAMMMVIYLHSVNLKELGLSHKSASIFIITFENMNIYIQNLISRGLTKVAVPLFFIISGFLFFLNTTSYKSKIQKRFYTLLIPYLFWAFLYVLIIFILQTTPILQSYFNSELIKNLSFSELLYHTWIEPKNYPLWFLRDLIFLVLISPLLNFFTRNYTIPYFTLLLLVWYLHIFYAGAQYSSIIGPILFFSFGVYLSYWKDYFLSFQLKDSLFRYLLIVYFTLLLVGAFLATFYPDNRIFIIFLLRTSTLLGIPVFWFMLDRYFIRSKVLLFLSQFTFLFFVFQEPMLTILKRGAYLLLGKTPESSLFIYFMLPILIIILLTATGLLLKRYLPKFSKIVTGNRL